MFVFPFKGRFNFFTVLLKMHFSARNVFQSERVLNIFNMVWRASMVGLQIRTLDLFTVFKWIFDILIHFAGNIYKSNSRIQTNIFYESGPITQKWYRSGFWWYRSNSGRYGSWSWVRFFVDQFFFSKKKSFSF